MNTLALHNVSLVTVELLPEAVAERDRLIAQSSIITSITTAEECESAATVVRSMKAMAKTVESGRESAKAPILNLGRQVDGVARAITDPLISGAKRVEGLITIWQREQQRLAAEAERKRQEEVRKAQEAKAKAEAEVRARDEAVRAAQAERARAQAEKDFAAARAARQAEVEARQKATLERIKAEQAEAARIKAAASIAVPQVKQAGVSMRSEPRFEVVNLVELVKADILRPTVTRLVTYEPSAAYIKTQIRNGMTEFPGLRIWWEQMSSVR